MKKIMMIAAMMVATVAAKAQFEPGTFSLQPKVGLNLASITADDTKYKAGFAAGIEGQYQINNWFALSAGVMYQQMGTSFKDSKYSDVLLDEAVTVETKDFKLNTEYVTIPIMAKFYVTKGLSLNVGLQPGFMTKAKTKGQEIINGMNLLGNDEYDVKESCNKFDLSVPMSIAYELPMGLTFEARYTYGVTNVGKDAFDSKTSSYDKLFKNKNDVFQITVGYKFAL
jgi:hypothetical protein